MKNLINSDTLAKYFIVSMFCLFLFFLAGLIINPQGKQASVFFLKGNNYMADYHNVLAYSADNNPYLHQAPKFFAEERVAPPMVFVLGKVMGRIGGPNSTFYPQMDSFAIIISTLAVLYISIMFFMVLQNGANFKYKQWLVFALMLSSIFMFSFERGNIILLAAVFSSFFVFNYDNKNPLIKELAFVSLALAAALKISPALLGILLIEEKRDKESTRLILYGLLFFFIPFFFINGGFNNIPDWIENIKLNSAIYEYRCFPRFNFRYWLCALNDSALKQNIHNLLAAGGLILGVLAVLSNKFLKYKWQRLLQLSLVLSTIFINSGEYTGLYLFAPIILFFNEKEHTKLDIIFLFCFILLLNPYRLMDISTALMNASASVMLIILTIISCVEGFKNFKEKNAVV